MDDHSPTLETIQAHLEPALSAVDELVRLARADVDAEPAQGGVLEGRDG